jgi:hypothetical protein
MENFYIGWQKEMSPQHKKTLKRFLIPIFILIPILVIGVILLQKHFNNHQFEFGNIKSFTGVYHENPYPILEITEGEFPENFSKFALLVGYGKFGAKGTIEMIEAQNGQKLNGKTITITGSLIYGDGKTVIELTKQENSLVNVLEERQSPSKPTQSITNQSLKGEVIDPKCYFGVMKPAEGKIHQSCAVRCISGGIPPVFRTLNAENNYDYYLIINRNSESIYQEILPIVAQEVTLTGDVKFENGWKILYINDDFSGSILR